MSRLIASVLGIASLATLGFMLGSTPARAAEPVCITDSDAGGVDCAFDTMAECQAALSGMAGNCEAEAVGSATTTTPTRVHLRTKMPAKGLPFNHSFRTKRS
jgi:hypothetical protein